MTTASVAGLYVYPVKSCRGIAIPQAHVGERGLALACGTSLLGDREWMIVDGAGCFITQREVPRLALVETAMAADALRLSMPGVPDIDVPLTRSRGEARAVVVWSSTVLAHDEGPAVATWLAAALGIDVRLVRFDTSHERTCNPQFAGASGAHTAFADGYPLLVASEESLADLNDRLAATATAALPMNRFRPNIVLCGLPAYDEDHLDSIELNGVMIKPVKPCTRCITTTTDQATAIRGPEPLSTLAGYRQNDTLGGVTFGMNAIITSGAGHDIAVGATARCVYRF